MRKQAAALTLGSVASVQGGQAFGKLLAGVAGPFGVITLRLSLAALALLVIWRPRPPPPGTRMLVIGLGTAIAGMNLIYLALERLPIGIAVTLQFLGPFTVALAGTRRPRDTVWAVLAGAGIAMFYRPAGGLTPTAGTVLALVSGASMACYTVLSKHVGARTPDGSLLAWAVALAAVLSLPAGMVAGRHLIRPGILLAGAGIALSGALAWSFDLAALRRLPARVVAVLQSLEPAAGGLAGLLIAGQHLTSPQWLAISCVTAAAAGSVATAPAQTPPRRRSRCPDHNGRSADHEWAEAEHLQPCRGGGTAADGGEVDADRDREPLRELHSATEPRVDGLAILLQPRGIAGHRRVVVQDLGGAPVSTTMSSPPWLSKLSETSGCRRMFASRLPSA